MIPFGLEAREDWVGSGSGDWKLSGESLACGLVLVEGGIGLEVPYEIPLKVPF